MMPAFLRRLCPALFALSAQAWAEPLRIEQRVAPACAAAARELGQRLEHALGQPPPSELDASVAIDAVEAGFRVTIALRDAQQARGKTAIDAPTCEEAVDAAAVVLALAFGKARRPEEKERAVPEPERAGTTPAGPSPEAASAGSYAQPVLTATSTAAPASADRRAPRDSAPASASERALRIGLATGVDRGTLPHPTVTLAGALARSFGVLELAAVARYGLPIAEETVETVLSESQRHDFASLELRACRGLGGAVRFSACAGAEVSAVRERRALQGEDRAELDRDQVSPRLSGTVATLVEHRGGLIEPGLELAGAAVALGRDSGAPWLAVRVAAGAAIAF